MYYYEVRLIGDNYSDYVKSASDDIDTFKASYKLKGKAFKFFREITETEYLAGVEAMFECWS